MTAPIPDGLARNGVARSAPADSRIPGWKIARERIARLRQHSRHDPMEGDAIVESVVRQLRKVLDGPRAVAVEELGDDRPAGRLDGRVLCGHAVAPGYQRQPESHGPQIA